MPLYIAVTCKPMDHLDNGKINYVYPLVFDSLVDYSCDYGFRLIGPPRRRCGPEGKLEGDIPVCMGKFLYDIYKY